MKFSGSRRAIRLFCATAVMGGAHLGLGSAEAAVTLTTPSSDPASGSVLANARFRVDNNAWDIFLDDTPSPTVGSPQANLGNIIALSGKSIDLLLKYDSTEGELTFTLTPDGGSATNLTIDKDESFDQIILQPRALADKDGRHQKLQLTDVTFTYDDGTGTSSESFAPGALDVEAEFTGSSVNDVTYGLIESNTDLSLIDWEIAATLLPEVLGTGNPSERLKLDIFLIPEPAAATLLGLPLLLARRTRRRA